MTSHKIFFLYSTYKRKIWIARIEKAPPVVRQHCYSLKVKINVWWNFEVIVCFKLVSEGRHVNARLYSEQMGKLYVLFKGREYFILPKVQEKFKKMF